MRTGHLRATLLRVDAFLAHRVVAACGAMADGTPYADLPVTLMAGNYGPASLMKEAVSGYTPNTPWARRGKTSTV